MFPLGSVGFPVLPVFFSRFGSLSSDSIVNCSPRTQDITRETIFEGIFSSTQERFCGSGNLVLKKLESEVEFLKESPCLKALDEISAMSFSAPGMLRVVRDDAPDANIRRPSIRSSLAAGIDLEVRNLFAQLTADVLSQ